MHINRIISFIVLCLLFVCSSHAEDPFTFLSLKGYLSKEELAKSKTVVDSLSDKQQLIVEVNSSSGDINAVLDLAKKIYEQKSEKKTHVIVYIADNAVGPAGILPFLADELYTSLFVSWGDIPLGTNNAVPTNLLRNRVVSLISPENSKADLLRVLASGMTDPAIQIVDDHGWKLSQDTNDQTHPVVSVKGETLVLNQNQLKTLGLVKDLMTADRFHSTFKFSDTQTKLSFEIPSSLQQLAIPESKLMESLQKHVKVNKDGVNHVGLIKIDDRTNGINQSTWLYVKAALAAYKESKPDFIIVELNTPGGEVYAAQQISDALKEMDTQYNIPCVAYINNWAISAGAMLAYSCRYITVVKDGAMGAAAPVIASETGEMKEASEKVNSALRADFANRARFFDRNPNLAEGMVDKDIILVLRHGQIIKIDNENQLRSTGPDPDVLIKAKGKLLTLSSEQLIEYGVADLLLPPKPLEGISAQELDKGEWPASKNLLFSAPFFKDIPQAIIKEYKPDWKTRFFMLLSHPIVSSILFLGMMLGFYMELNTPGATLPGTIGLICLFLIILSSFAQEIGNVLELIFLVTGLMILLVEIFVLPTFGLLGFFGILLFIVGLFGLMLPGANQIAFEFDTQTLNAAGEAFMNQLVWLCGTLVVGTIIIGLLARYVMPKFQMFNRFVLTGGEQDGYVAVDTLKEFPEIGSEGEVVATLRPGGKVIVKDKIYDAITTGGFLEKGSKVKVVDYDAGTMIVKSESGDKE